MKLERFKEKNKKQASIIIFTILCILLVSGVMLYRTFAIFEVRTNQNVIKGTVQDPGNIYFAFYKDNEIQKDIPEKDEGYVLDEEASYCGVNGNHDESIKISLTEDYTILVHGVTTSRTKCTLYFVKGKFIQGKGIPIVEAGDGLYTVEHSDSTLEDNDWHTTEYRYAGKNPNNYIRFNNELWRIIGLVNVKTSSGSIEQRLKIIKNESIGNFSWDYDGSTFKNDWTNASLMKMLNGIYYENGNGEYWTEDNNKSTCSFTETEHKGLKEVQSLIDQEIIWSIAGIKGNEVDSDNENVKMFYDNERGSTSSNPSEWKKEDEKIFESIGLLSPSDYGYGTSGGTTGRNNCFTTALYSWNFNQECGNSDWLKPNSNIQWTWTITARTFNTSYVLLLDSNGSVHRSHSKDARNVFPSLYLKTNVKILNDGQDGSAEKPFNLISII